MWACLPDCRPRARTPRGLLRSHPAPRYITNPKSIILAVSAANNDIATSDSIKIAREVDPSGSRTIGVLTKLDLMDKGTVCDVHFARDPVDFAASQHLHRITCTCRLLTLCPFFGRAFRFPCAQDACEVLAGHVIPLQLGIVGVVNRSQHDIDSRKSIAGALAAEEAFFARQYPTLKHRCGKGFLAKTLSKLLMHHIRDSLPELKSRIQDMQISTSRQLESLGEPIKRDMDSGGLLLRILTNFSQAFNDSIEGRAHVAVNNHELAGGAMICHIFHNTYAHSLQNIGAMDGLSLGDIQTAIRNATGTRRSPPVPTSF